jgi:integration host factor subunit beta
MKLPKGRSEQVLDVLFDCLEKALCRDERIEIRGFGSFELRHYRARQGRNPRTGASVAVKPKRLPYFKVGKELRARVAKGKRAPRAEAAPILQPENLSVASVEIPNAKF